MTNEDLASLFRETKPNEFYEMYDNISHKMSLKCKNTWLFFSNRHEDRKVYEELLYILYKLDVRI